jgi:putative transposase/transposase-like zinc-binding protein
MNTAAATGRPVLEVADIIRTHGDDFLAHGGASLSTTQRQALRDLTRCRTAALGGHRERCLDCGCERLAYNSCRNRHCPKCQALSRARWLDREATYLLPVEYFHVVFTLPAEIAELALVHPALLYDLLFQAAAATLREVAADPKWLGAVVGLLLVLHTWGQNLHHHPHVHGIVTGGGLSCDKSGRIDDTPCWRACRPGFFLPVRVLSRVFRGKFLALLRAAFDQGQMVFSAGTAPLKEKTSFQQWLKPLYDKDWVVYAKPPFGGSEQVLKYLARYTHRVAISNQRLVSLQDDRVTFRYKDYAADQRQRTMTLSAREFLRRFLQHVLPKGFVKIRHYGLLANRHRQQRLTQCRRLLLVVTIAPALTNSQGAAPLVATARPFCPHCGSSRIIRSTVLSPGDDEPETSRDTS